MYLQTVLCNIFAYMKRHGELSHIADMFYLLSEMNGMFVPVTTYHFKTRSLI